MPDKIPLRVLLVEDSAFDALMVVNVLRQSGYSPTSTRVDTEAAMRLALSQQSWDLVIADYSMPNFSMMEALQILRDSGLDLPFIIVSGGIGDDAAVAAMKAGAHDYVMKGNLLRLGPAVSRELREAAMRSARQHAEQALRESELRYRKLWETSTDAVILVDEHSQINLVNPAVEKVFGYKPEELMGQSLEILQPRHLHPAHLAGMQHFLVHGSTPGQSLIETTGLRKDGKEISLEIAFNEMTLHGQRWLVAFIRDTTERRRAEMELRETQEQFQIAREIQQRLFPGSAPQMPGFDLAGVSYPAEATGGDYFDYFPMFSPGLGIGIGDVSGHGIGPALLMAETRAYLRILARNRDDLGDILIRANRILAEDVGSERFVTLLLAKLIFEPRSLLYASAGHTTGYVLNAAGEIKAALKRTGIPLGIQPDTHYQVGPEIPLETGDLVLLITDGIEETLSPDNEFFGIDRILEVVRSNRQLSAREIVEALYQAGRKFTNSTPLGDDFTAVVLKVLPEA